MTDLEKRIARLGAQLRASEAREEELVERCRLLLLELGRAACGVPPEVAYCTICGQIMTCTADGGYDANDYRDLELQGRAFPMGGE